MNGKLKYECEFCCLKPDVKPEDISTFSVENGMLIKFEAECEYCGELIEIEITVKDEQ